MGFTAFTHEIWCPQLILMRDAPREFTNERWNLQYLRMRDGIYNIYSFEMGYSAFNFERLKLEIKVFTHKRWLPQNVLLRVWAHSINLWEMEDGHQERWRTWYLLMIYGVEGIYL